MVSRIERKSLLLSGLLVIIALVFASIQPAIAAPNRVALADPPPDQVVIKLKPGVAIGSILTRYNAEQLGTIPESNLYFLRLLGGQAASQLLPVLNNDSSLYYAEPNYYVDGSPAGGAIMFTAHSSPSAVAIMFTAHGELTPVSPTGDQWAWTKIGLAEAQKLSTGLGIIIAVLDTGLAPDHALLKSSITAGYDFVGMTNNIYDTGTGNEVGHGTHVSGIIVTEAPGVQIMPIRVLNSAGLGTYWEVAAGIRYAVDHGARIINMSMSAPRLTPSLAEALSYAAAHGVLVVSAAGPGEGPNYPAAYSDRLAVVGVGATDENDTVAAFSGGQLGDTDIFAPGVNIYSAFPYNGYALGSGTSMAAPIISAEAALMLARYPNWTLAQVTQRILAKVNPLAGWSAGRANLATALNSGLELRYQVGDNNSPNDNNIKPRLLLINNTPEDIPLSQIKIRYWYTIDSDKPQSLNCDWATVPCPAISGIFARLADGNPNKTSTSDTYLEVGFNDGAGVLSGGGSAEMYLRFNKSDWSNYTEANDYSFSAARTTYASWDHITVYRNGSLSWGLEPAGGTQATSTQFPPPPPSATYSSTVTRNQTKVVTNKSTQTQTKVATNTPTQTKTPAQTATRTPTVPTGTTCSVAYSVTNDWGSGFGANVTITNLGTAAINGWTLTWSFPGNQTIASLWAGTYTQNGSSVSVKNVDYNGIINPEGTVSFGFNASYSGGNAPPVAFTINGMACK